MGLARLLNYFLLTPLHSKNRPGNLLLMKTSFSQRQNQQQPQNSGWNGVRGGNGSGGEEE